MMGKRWADMTKDEKELVNLKKRTKYRLDAEFRAKKIAKNKAHMALMRRDAEFCQRQKDYAASEAGKASQRKSKQKQRTSLDVIEKEKQWATSEAGRACQRESKRRQRLDAKLEAFLQSEGQS